MKTNKLQNGFSLLLILVIVVAVGIVGFKGYEVVRSNIETNEAVLSQPAVADDVPVVTDAAVVDTSDLDKANALLDQIDLNDGKDAALLDSEMAAF